MQRVWIKLQLNSATANVARIYGHLCFTNTRTYERINAYYYYYPETIYVYTNIEVSIAFCIKRRIPIYRTRRTLGAKKYILYIRKYVCRYETNPLFSFVALFSQVAETIAPRFVTTILNVSFNMCQSNRCIGDTYMSNVWFQIPLRTHHL